jgi:3-isopropylmalate dehydratase small subunit
LDQAIHFIIDLFWRECLLSGAGEITLTLSYQHKIDTSEQKHHADRP